MNNKVIIFTLVGCLLIIQGCLNFQNRWIGGLGVTLAQIEDGVVIKDIAPTFESEKTALLPGDKIIQIDETDVSNWPKGAILEAISGPVGATVAITVVRDDQALTFEIERIMDKNAAKATLRSVQKGAVPVVSLQEPQPTPVSETTEKEPRPEPDGATETPAADADTNSSTVPESPADTDTTTDTEATTDTDSTAAEEKSTTPNDETDAQGNL